MSLKLGQVYRRASATIAKPRGRGNVVSDERSPDWGTTHQSQHGYHHRHLLHQLLSTLTIAFLLRAQRLRAGVHQCLDHDRPLTHACSHRLESYWPDQQCTSSSSEPSLTRQSYSSLQPDRGQNCWQPSSC